MKKYGFILGFALAAVGASAQLQNAELYQFGVKNSALINQSGLIQSASITQVGMNNGARVLQDGAFNLADVQQYGAKNYASLEQKGIFTMGSILQVGAKNLAAVKQASFSMVDVKQFGYGNILASTHSRLAFVGCRLPRETYANWCFDRCNLAIPRPFAAVEVGVGDRLKVKQTGDKNIVLTMGKLEGAQYINQMGYKNLIILGQDGGVSKLTQKGVENFIWLKMKDADKAKISQFGMKNLVALNLYNGEAKISQVGFGNSVAYYGKGICKNCPTEPATFKGDDLYVSQVGVGNKLSLKSETFGSDVKVVQMGYQNYGTIIQTSAGHHNNGCGNCGDH